ncbi:cyclin e [Nesidiocoris tenuis]|uniref:Cyclin e n=1 Tax=Nesidiocoris tenuis TaxID=355587 RepID=A0ABN7B2D7_9HEMI|nr:cyclin e [Nesidiocoris tenuis]
MQRDGSKKRKRSSDNDGENSLAGKKPRHTLANIEGVERSAEERQPFAELLIVEQPAEQIEIASVGSDSDIDWLDAQCDEILDDENSKDFEEDEPAIGDDEIDRSAPTSPAESLNDSLVSVSLASKDNPLNLRVQFSSKEELADFFNRKARTCDVDRTDAVFENNPGLLPRMRSVLLEWLVEVCDVYKIHRETYHLTVDYLDRYLAHSENVSKSELQLIGVTALFIASKYEEIYPPKISDYAYITDGACTVDDIMSMETRMINVLSWKCTVITSNAWALGLFQLLSIHERNYPDNVDITCPQYLLSAYQTVAHLLDLCSLDPGFVKYSYKILALSSVRMVVPDSPSLLLEVFDLAEDDLTDCLDWMQPFWLVLSRKCDYGPYTSKEVLSDRPSRDCSHLLIKHNISLDMLEDVKKINDNIAMSDVLLTPPISSEKRRKSQNRAVTNAADVRE